MNFTNEELKHLRDTMNSVVSAAGMLTIDREIVEKIDEFLNNHEHGIDCPHCYGDGRVPEDFLTDDHVAEVFRQYCDIFGVHYAYGVESWSDDGWNGDTVHIRQDTSCRGCYDYETHVLPRSYFTRNVEKRRELMIADLTDEKRKKEIKEEEDRKAHIAALERQIADLRAKAK